jgi:hypothetical protein
MFLGRRLADVGLLFDVVGQQGKYISILQYVVWTSPPPPFRHYHFSAGLAYPYDWRGFVEAKKKTSVVASLHKVYIYI